MNMDKGDATKDFWIQWREDSILQIKTIKSTQRCLKSNDSQCPPLKKMLRNMMNIIRERATSKRCQFFLSNKPFCFGVLTQELWYIIPFFFKKSPRIDWIFFPIISVKNLYICIRLILNHGIEIWKKKIQPQNFLLKDKQQTQVWSSVKVMNHLLFVILWTRNGPQMSLCIKAKGFNDWYGWEGKKGR